MKRLFPTTLLVIALVLLLLVGGRAADQRSSGRENLQHQVTRNKQDGRSNAANARNPLYVNFIGPVRPRRNSEADLAANPIAAKKRNNQQPICGW